MTGLYLWAPKRPGPEWTLIAVKDGGYWRDCLWYRVDDGNGEGDASQGIEPGEA